MKEIECAFCGAVITPPVECWNSQDDPVCEDCDREYRCDDCMEFMQVGIGEDHLCDECRKQRRKKHENRAEGTPRVPQALS